MKYRLLALGGTFDHLHSGHKAFLRWSFSQAEHVLLGLTTDMFVQTNKNDRIQSFVTRKKILEQFFQTEHVIAKVTIIPIDDVYGPLLATDFPVDSLAVTDATYKNAQAINRQRHKLHLPQLSLVRMPLMTGENNLPISSTAIRAGSMSKQGNQWVKNDWQHGTYRMPEALRSILQQPFGTVATKLPDHINPLTIITVGDVTTQFFNKHHIGQKLSIVDFIVERHKKFSSLEEIGFTQTIRKKTFSNPAGHIVGKAWKIIKDSLKEPSSCVIQVDGEEDLLVLVCLLVAPLGYTIFYGQPGQGMVQLTVTHEEKQYAFDLMSKFVRIEL